MADYVDDYITGNIEKLLRKQLNPKTQKALKESAQKSRAAMAVGKTRIGNLAGRGGSVRGGGAGGASGLPENK